MTDALDILIEFTDRLKALRDVPRPQEARNLFGWLSADGVSSLVPGLGDFLQQVSEAPTVGFRPSAYQTPVLERQGSTVKRLPSLLPASPQRQSPLLPAALKKRTPTPVVAETILPPAAPAIHDVTVEFKTSDRALLTLLKAYHNTADPNAGTFELHLTSATTVGDVRNQLADIIEFPGAKSYDIVLKDAYGYALPADTLLHTQTQPISVALSAAAKSASNLRGTQLMQAVMDVVDAQNEEVQRFTQERTLFQ
ncbi:Hypothetical protein POVN_LOCUS438 [uncultured virus]|nr:Hypothetical protein POVN_LOCUS438 [uncultured virus]